MNTKEQPRIAVIGLGPRSLGALEALAAGLGDHARPLQVDGYDPFAASGAGPNFDPEDLPVCRLNIPMRDIDIRPPEFTERGDFAEWHDAAPDPDSFPTRADLGRYLTTRYADLAASGRLSIRHSPQRVTDIKRTSGGWMLRAAEAWQGPYGEVLLCLGQPEVQPDQQLAEWQQHAESSAGTLAQAYPAKTLLSKAADWTGQTIAIRGLALSAFDVLRVLTTARGGQFDNGRYLPSGREPARILPFSLDGLPPYPKPETAALDARFAPTAAETQAFEEAIRQAARTAPERAQRLVNDALVLPVARILAEHGASNNAEAVADWLQQEWSAPGSQEADSPKHALQHGIAMAEGTAPPSLGYTVGQLWRKWQDQLRRGFNPADTRPDTAEAIIGFDEGLKRYSYGPPVSSSRELSALIAAGLVDLDYAIDPDITLTKGGWALRSATGTAEAGVMIDAVMAAPDLSTLRTPLLLRLKEEGWLCPLSDHLAARTAPDGQLVADTGDRVPGLCLLGRLSLGSVVAADSLHDCFGAASHRWAKGVLERMG